MKIVQEAETSDNTKSTSVDQSDKTENEKPIAENKMREKTLDSRALRSVTSKEKTRRRAPSPPSSGKQPRVTPPETKEAKTRGKRVFEESEELRRLRSILNQGKDIQTNKHESSDKSAPKPRRTSSSSEAESSGKSAPKPRRTSSFSEAESSGKSAPKPRRTSSSSEAESSANNSIHEDQNMAETDSPSSSVSPRGKKYGLGHAAAAQAYAQSRKMNFDNIEVRVPPRREIQNEEYGE